MNFVLLSIFFCTSIANALSNAGPLSILQPIKQMSLLEKFKADPNAFVSEMSKADPLVLKQIISMLEGLLTTSVDREGELVDNLNDKQTALDDANGRLVAAGVVLSQAQTAQAAADAAVVAATDDVAAKQAEQGVAQTERDDAQQQHDNEIDSLNDEQAVLRQVIEILKNLLDMQPTMLNTAEYCGTNRNQLVCPDGVAKSDAGQCVDLNFSSRDYTVGGVPVGLLGWSDHGIYMHNNARELYANDATWAEKLDITQKRCKQLCEKFDACVGLTFVENENIGLLRCDLHDVCPWTAFTNNPDRAPEHWYGWKK